MFALALVAGLLAASPVPQSPARGVVVSGGEVGGGCNTLQIDNSGEFNDQGNFSFYTYKAVQFTTSGAITVCKAELDMYRSGSASGGTLTVKIYSNSGGNPGALVGSGSAAVNCSDVGTVFGVYETFSGLNASLAAGTTYWLVIEASETDSAVYWVTKSGGAGRGATDGSTWDNTGQNGDFKLYSE